MENKFEIIKSLLERYSELNNHKQKIVQSDLLIFARENRDFFLLKIQEIKPHENSILFEVYEILSQEAETWVDFIISEFNRIKLLTETAKKKEQKSISYPLTALTFFAQQNFSGIDKLKTTIKSGLHSKSENIVMICLDLLSDIYYSNKSEHSDCKLTIERLQNSKSKKIGQFAKELLKEIDSAPKKNDSTLKKIVLLFIPSYATTVFLVGLFLSIKTVDLFDNTFVTFGSVVVVFIVGAILSGLIHYFIAKNKPNVLNIMLGYGFMFVFLWLFLNFNFSQSESKSEIFKINKKGTLGQGRYIKCSDPYIKFTRKNIVKRIDFNCSETELVDKSNLIKIETSIGLFGFEIIKQKELMNDGRISK